MGDHVAGGQDRAEHVDSPRELPQLVGGVEPGTCADAGVGAEDVDVADVVEGARHEVSDRRLVAHIAVTGLCADGVRDRGGTAFVEIGDHHVGGAELCEPFA